MEKYYQCNECMCAFKGKDGMCVVVDGTEEYYCSRKCYNKNYGIKDDKLGYINRV